MKRHETAVLCILHRTIVGLSVAFVLAAGVQSAFAVEVRQAEPRYKRGYLSSPPQAYQGRMTRAYAACTTPNDVSSDGIAACSPPVTSICSFATADLTIEPEPRSVPFVVVGLTGRDGLGDCATGDYFAEITVRVTTDPYDATDQVTCTSGTCTFEDVVVRKRLDTRDQSYFVLDDLPALNIRDASFEILGVVIIAPDGLPLAAAGLDAAEDARSLTSPLSLAYDPCTTPDPDGSGFSCNASTPGSACDFEFGDVAWHLDDANRPALTATLHDLAGASPLCTTGTYHAEATLRATVKGCGGGATPCTLVDTTVSLPLPAARAGIAADVPLADAGITDDVIEAEILTTRILDPNTTPLAATALPCVRSLASTKLTVKDRSLKLVTLYPPIEASDQFIDPTAGTVTIVMSSHGHVFYQAVIPGSRWQLGTPVGTRWSIVDPGGAIAGIRKISITRKGPFKLKLVVANVDLSGADFPGVDVTIGIPRDPDEPTSDLTSLSWAQQAKKCRMRIPSQLSCH